VQSSFLWKQHCDCFDAAPQLAGHSTMQNHPKNQSISPRHVIATGDGPLFLRRKQAGNYLLGKYGFGSHRTLAKMVVTGGGPEFHKAGRAVLYRPEELDLWAQSKIGTARRSSSDAE
jgi:hypothetical protein